MEFNTLKTLLQNVKGSTFVGIDTLTKVALKGGKKNPMQGRVTKRVTGSNIIIFHGVKASAYAAMVKRRLEKEGKDADNFELKPRQWGERIAETCFVQHTNKEGELKYYFEAFFIKAGKVEYLLDGEPIAKEDIEGLDPAKESEDSQGGLENKVIIRTYAVESITAVRFRGEEVT